MNPMFEESVFPYLRKKQPEIIYSQMVKICGYGESQVEDKLLDLIDAQTNPTIATYAKTGEVHLRVTAKVASQEEAEKLRAAADYEVAKTLAESERQGRILRGEGDAEAAKLFADAFSQDPDFYAFIRSLRAYENSFQSNQDVMVLSPDSDFFRYMKTPTNATR